MDLSSIASFLPVSFSSWLSLSAALALLLGAQPVLAATPVKAPVKSATPAKAPAPAPVPDVDTDGDGLSDRLEALFGTNPNLPDTDGDGFLDGQEIQNDWSPTSTSAVPLVKSIHIDLSDQKLEERLNGVTIATYTVSSGKASTPTPVGTYKILNKSPKAWSKMAGLWMPYWMAFTTKGHGIHELPEWPNGYKEGANHLGTPVSHGCVRLGIGPAKAMYDWAPIGTPVIIER